MTTRAPGTEKRRQRRHKANIHLTLAFPVVERLDAIAEHWGTSRTGAVERLVREESDRRRGPP
jgi:hypothetical protein